MIRFSPFAQPDNDAGLQYTPRSIQGALCPDEPVPKQLLSPAAICELADRVQTDNFQPNLDRVLFPKAPRAVGPSPRRGPAAQRGVPRGSRPPS